MHNSFNYYLEMAVQKNSVLENSFFGKGESWFVHLSNSANLTIENVIVPKVKGGYNRPNSGFWLAPNLAYIKKITNTNYFARDKNKKYIYKIKLDLSHIIITKGKFQEAFYKDFKVTDWDKIPEKRPDIDGIWFSKRDDEILDTDFKFSDVEPVVLYNKEPIKEIKLIGDFSNSLNKREELKNHK
jgi:hypothetical protein